MAPKQLVVYDFDWSLADQDTDRYVLEVLSTPLRREMETLASQGVQWTDIVAQTVAKLQETKGTTKKQIEDALTGMPFVSALMSKHPAMKRAVLALQAASTPETTFFCLSNSNSVYIDTILRYQGLTNLFSRITTNPASWTDDGKLIIKRRVDPLGPQHGCKVGCSANMCKGEELVAFLKEHSDFERVIYVGDGGNDFCPLLRLKKTDLALVRTDVRRELQDRIAREGEAAGLCCQITYWGMAWEVEEIFSEGGIAQQL